MSRHFTRDGGKGTRTSILRWASWVVIVALSLGCGSGGGSSSGSSGISAPTGLSARTIDCTITSGSGVFATTGTFSIVFSPPSPVTTYEIERDGVPVVTNSGTYSYSADGAVCTANFTYIVIGEGTFVFSCTRRYPQVGEATTSEGTYSANAASGGTHTATFVSMEAPVKASN